jgi:ATP-dependent DNA ligase
VPFIPRCSQRAWTIRAVSRTRYIAKPKLDGQRAQLHVREHRTVPAFSRPGRELLRLPGLVWLRELE